MSGLDQLNALPRAEAAETLLRCCGARRWAEKMADARPFSTHDALFAAAERIWGEMKSPDWHEAFGHHPRIGSQQLRDRWAAGEQKGIQGASEETLQQLEQGNRDYEARFNHIYLVCATGKSAHEMLELLRKRMKNDPQAELRVAAGEQAKITRIRLEKLMEAMKK